MKLSKNQHPKQEFICLKKPIEEFLNKEDIDYYRKLKNTLSSHICRNCRNRRRESFSEILSTIHYYINRKNEDSWKRSLICGICWYKNYIVVNIRQMSSLLEKCKSSINGSFQRLNFIMLSDKQESVKIINEAIPYLKNYPDLIQTWSVRQQAVITPMIIPFIPVNQVVTSNTKKRKYTKKAIQKEKSIKQENKAILPIEISIEPEIHEEIPVNSDQNTGNKMNNNSSNEQIRDLFEEQDLFSGTFDRYNIF